jgi:subtilisin family serine protease
MKKKVIGLFVIFALVYGIQGIIEFRPTKMGSRLSPERGLALDHSHQVGNRQGIVPSAPDRILVKYRKKTEPVAQSLAVASIEAAYGLQRVDYFPSSDVHLYRTVLSKDRMIEELKKNPDVQYAEPDYVVHGDQVIRPSAIPNDPSLTLQWGMHNTGQTGGTADADIDAPEAWSLTTGNSDVVVGVIDTGVDYNHVDLNANMWRNHGEILGNGIDDDGNGYIDDYYGINAITNSGDPMDDNRHGTHVAGIIGAVGNNGIGVAGACWPVRLMKAIIITRWRRIWDSL